MNANVLRVGHISERYIPTTCLLRRLPSLVTPKKGDKSTGPSTLEDKVFVAFNHLVNTGR